MPRKPTPAQTVALPHADYLRARLLEVEKVLAEKGAASRNLAAYVAASRLATELHAELDALTRPAVAPATDPLDELDDDALRAKLFAEVLGLPEALLAELENAIVGKRSGKPILRVVGE